MTTEEDIVRTLEQHAAGGDFDAAWARATDTGTKPRRRPWINVAVAVAAAAVLIFAAWPRPEPPPVEGAAVAVPAEDSGLPEDADTISMFESMSVVLSFPRRPSLVDVGGGDALVAVEQLTTRKYRFVGRGEGETVARITFDDGEQSIYRLEVMPPKRPEGYESTDSSIVFAVGEPVTLTLPRPAEAVGLPDADIASGLVEGTTIVLTGVAPGVSDLVLCFDDDTPPMVYELAVTGE